MMPMMIVESNKCEEVNPLANQATRRLAEGDYKAALWRLIDSAGLIAETLEPAARTPVLYETGRGFRLYKRA